MPLRSGFSSLQQQRLTAGHNRPKIFKDGGLVVTENAPTQVTVSKDLQEAFPTTCSTPTVFLKPGVVASRAPLNIGVVLSGGQAPGGHNVIAGLFDYIKTVSPESKLIGFKDGPHGIFSHIYVTVDDDMISQFRNTGGFDMLGSGRHKIETPDQFEASMKVCADLNLHGLVVIGGDDSNTNACVLGEYFKSHGAKTNVIGCPKTIDGDLKNLAIPISFGFDTACRTYAEQVGNVERDALGAQKYYHFVRLMGRSASHIALEVALQTRPNVCLIGEEVSHLKLSLAAITQQLVDVVERRAAAGKNYGVVLLPEGLIEFIPEIGTLISEVNDLLAAGTPPNDDALLAPGKLSPHSAGVFRLLPPSIREQLLLDRDPHGNVQVAKIETEMLLASTVAAALEARHKAGSERIPFVARFHNFGYEGRSAIPSMFDADYCYALGLTAGGLISNGLCSVMACVNNLLSPVAEWTCGGTPIPGMMHFERRHGKMKPVIAKALVELEGNPFKAFVARREDWTLQDYYRCPGPLQFNLPPEVSQQVPLTLKYELLKAGGPDPDAHVPADVPALQFKSFPLGGHHTHLFRPMPAMNLSPLESLRLTYKPNLPPILKAKNLSVSPLGASQSVRRRDAAIMQTTFPNTYGQPLLEFEECSEAAAKPPVTVGVVFCGRQSPGGHCIVSGLYDALTAIGGKLLGFIAGTKGLLAGQAVEITDEILATARNTGGFDLLGRTVDHIDTAGDGDAIAAQCAKLGVGALVLVGGVRTQTDAAFLAEKFAGMEKAPAIIGVPTGIDGAIHGTGVEVSVGFDSACHMYAQLVGNTGTDAASARKYYHFLRVMGTSPSHIALEVALRTKPNATILAEEVAHKRQGLQSIVAELADVVVKRAQAGKDFGIILVPEGIAAAIPELSALIDELTVLQKEGKATASEVEKHLTPWSQAVYVTLPDFMKESLLLERQSNNKIQLSQIESERLLADLVANELAARKAAGTYKGKFSPVCSFLGYQARGSLPSNFDCDLGYGLGTAAAHLARSGCNGYLAVATGLKDPTPQWRVGGMPIVALMSAEDASAPPCIPESRVELTSQAYAAVKAAELVVDEKYENPGPLQFGGSTADARPLALIAQADPGYLQTVTALHSQLDALRDVCRPGCPVQLLHVAARSLANLTDTISLFHGEDVSFGDLEAYKRRKML